MEKATIKKLLTTEEACELLGVSRVTLMKLSEDGHFPIMKVGVQNRIDPADIQSYLERQKLASQ